MDKFTKILISPHPLSIGLPKVPSLQLRTKDNVDHAGPSQQPVHWNLLISSKKELLEISLNNSWLIAQPVMETMDVMEV
jgi:hypothetical protein